MDDDDEDARSHKEAKIEVFSEDEEDYDIGENNEFQGIESGSVHSHRSACASSSVSTQLSQWDEVIVERGGKFSKPAPQCIHWNNPKHRLDFPCRFWHPREQCRYYPNCSSTADECGFAHPFCADFCHCPKAKRDPQKNHRILEDRYFGGGDRVKYGGGSGTQ
ncbi:hypothetical protein Tcan_12748 [Toxocara canis]|uniref:C3H1-type domain-containing protein n=1 Tax=Toxocara canis TaxID=6265 RepID=A0A0B2VHR9_TOXCA|nr:hypothetical protein Tcan_12748 [Toxocara canis]